MPQKNSRKEYGAGGHYHVYNRGVEKRKIFLDEQDFKVFLGYMKFYLEQSDLQGQALQGVSPSRAPKNYHGQIELLAYCLMPNHFHFLVKQTTDRAIAEFMQSLILKYVMYFNKKYKRVGGLFQGRYKTVLISDERQFIYIAKYIHRNPIDILPAGPGPAGLVEYKYSSYGNYLGVFKQSWVNTEDLLAYFSKANLRNTYQAFVEESGDVERVYKEMIDLDD
ncbi:MAG: transposase [Patescibacteria group bacterium]